MLYEKDFLAWTQQQSELIRQGRWQEVDLDHLIEELEDMGKSNHRELESRLVVLLAHLLKWKFQLNQHKTNGRNSMEDVGEKPYEMAGEISKACIASFPH